VAGGLTVENVMDVLQEAKACDASDLLDSCRAFIRANPTEVRPRQTPVASSLEGLVLSIYIPMCVDDT
jgi:hypothetical protein